MSGIQRVDHLILLFCNLKPILLLADNTALFGLVTATHKLISNSLFLITVQFNLREGGKKLLNL